MCLAALGYRPATGTNISPIPPRWRRKRPKVVATTKMHPIYPERSFEDHPVPRALCLQSTDWSYEERVNCSREENIHTPERAFERALSFFTTATRHGSFKKTLSGPILKPTVVRGGTHQQQGEQHGTVHQTGRARMKKPGCVVRFTTLETHPWC